jgi:hypothetical protein
MSEFHAIIVDKSLTSQTILKDFKILSKTVDGGWTLYKILVNEDKLDSTIKIIQSQMNEGAWYFHFYNCDGSKMIVVFKNKIFDVNNDSKTWSRVLKYGSALGIPSEQLDFVPNRFANEKY